TRGRRSGIYRRLRPGHGQPGGDPRPDRRAGASGQHRADPSRSARRAALRCAGQYVGRRAGGVVMARIAAYTAPARGHLYPITPILDELRRPGPAIGLWTLGSQVTAMRARGFDVRPIDTRIEAIEHDDWRARNQLQAIRRAVRTFCDRAEHDAADVRRVIAEEQPDALLVDINCWGGLTVAEAWDGPWATFCPYPIPLRSSDAPPFGPGFAPARGTLGRLRDQLAQPLILRT